VAVYADGGKPKVLGITKCESREPHVDEQTTDPFTHAINETLVGYKTKGFTILEYSTFNIGRLNYVEDTEVAQSGTSKFVAHLPENQSTGFKWYIKEGNANIKRVPFQISGPLRVGAPEAFAILEIKDSNPVTIYNSRGESQYPTDETIRLVFTPVEQGHTLRLEDIRQIYEADRQGEGRSTEDDGHAGFVIPA
jgi:hypothetical protein